MATAGRQPQPPATDGSLQVVIAIASVTNLVTIDTTQVPPVVNPDNLGDLAFNDNAVGLSDGQMPIFKANLKVLLPNIGDDIDKIPDNSNLIVSAVAKIVRLALMSQP
jgi:hypothetical protein